MMTTVREMIEMLQDVDPDSELRIAQQPNYPFEYSLDTGSGPLVEVEQEEEGDDMPSVVYIVSGNQIGYLPQAAADAIGW